MIFTIYQAKRRKLMPTEQAVKGLQERQAAEEDSPVANMTADTDRLTLLGLPREIRDQIWELALYHAENGGVICPAAKGRSPTGKHTQTILKGGRRFTLKGRVPTPFGEPRDRSEDAFNATLRKWNELPPYQQNHMCRSKCLLQPPLTRVSSQVRRESLPIFYKVNKFHFEPASLKALSKGGKSGLTWWRAIGDTNLTSIRQLNLFLREGMMVRYRQPSASVRVTQSTKGDANANVDGGLLPMTAPPPMSTPLPMNAPFPIRAPLLVNDALARRWAIMEQDKGKERMSEGRLRQILDEMATHRLHLKAFEELLELTVVERGFFDRRMSERKELTLDVLSSGPDAPKRRADSKRRRRRSS